MIGPVRLKRMAAPIAAVMQKGATTLARGLPLCFARREWHPGSSVAPMQQFPRSTEEAPLTPVLDHPSHEEAGFVDAGKDDIQKVRFRQVADLREVGRVAEPAAVLELPQRH